ncbi:MAG: hypothetical protein GKS03_11405 [Alphaproteobacteria bacterium]|nr:hypothetical protein [Alphaproteobacteria bacterium]
MAGSLVSDLYLSSINTNLASITSSVQLSPKETAEAVKTNGIVIFPAAIDPDTVSDLNTEFDRMLDPEVRAATGFQVDEDDGLTNIRVIRERLNPAACPATAALYANPWMDEVSAAYYGVGAYQLNDEIFISDITETPGGKLNLPFALHFDKRQVLKFFVYLTDTDERNGAMRASPGSQIINRQRRLEAMEHGTLNEIPNVLPEPDVPSVPITGLAGTIFVFDTDMCHGAGQVEAGRSRRTMRGHTHSRQMLDAMAQDAATTNNQPV